jgi:Ca2+-binding RTX toxin-like protein
VLANDEDVDGDALTVEGVEDPAGGSVSVSPDGSSLVYTPPADASGSEVFAYTVTDGDGVDTGLVTVTIEPVNDPPVAVPDSLTVPQGSSTVADVLANDSPGPADESGQPLAVAGVGSPSHGAAELVTTGPDAGRIRYTPAPGYVGPDSFAYVVGDGSLTATGLVSVTVLPGPARPPCSLEPTIVGTVGDDVIVGTPSDDVIHARRGDDVIDGNGGNDVVCAGPGADTVSTGDGVDRIAAGPGADSVSSGGGADRVRGGFGADHLAAGGGDDVIAAGPGDDDVDAGDGRNAVSGGRGDDRLVAGSGDDRLHGGAGADTCDADGGRNTVVACEG